MRPDRKTYDIKPMSSDGDVPTLEERRLALEELKAQHE
jgi:hypothetical protein